KLVLIGARTGNESSGGVRQLGPHPGFLPGILDGLTRRAETTGDRIRVGTHDDKTVAHDGDDGVRGIPGGGAGADNGDTAGPGQGLSAVDADVALPLAVVDLA